MFGLSLDSIVRSAKGMSDVVSNSYKGFHALMSYVVNPEDAHATLLLNYCVQRLEFFYEKLASDSSCSYFMPVSSLESAEELIKVLLEIAPEVNVNTRLNSKGIPMLEFRVRDILNNNIILKIILDRVISKQNEIQSSYTIETIEHLLSEPHIQSILRTENRLGCRKLAEFRLACGIEVGLEQSIDTEIKDDVEEEGFRLVESPNGTEYTSGSENVISASSSPQTMFYSTASSIENTVALKWLKKFIKLSKNIAYQYSEKQMKAKYIFDSRYLTLKAQLNDVNTRDRALDTFAKMNIIDAMNPRRLGEDIKEFNIKELYENSDILMEAFECYFNQYADEQTKEYFPSARDVFFAPAVINYLDNRNDIPAILLQARPGYFDVSSPTFSSSP